MTEKVMTGSGVSRIDRGGSWRWQRCATVLVLVLYDVISGSMTEINGTAMRKRRSHVRLLHLQAHGQIKILGEDIPTRFL